MNPKYTTAGLAFGILIALAPETALAQNPKLQVRQKASTRSASPAPRTTDNPPADLPIGVLQGMEDAKRYQELVRRAEREGQPAPSLPYARPKPAAVPPAGATYTTSSVTTPGPSGASNGTNPTVGSYQPVMSGVPTHTSQPTQSLQSPVIAHPSLTVRQITPQPVTPPSPQQDHEELLRRYIEALYELHNDSVDSGFSLPAHTGVRSAPASQPISMPGPGPRSLPFGRKP